MKKRIVDWIKRNDPIHKAFRRPDESVRLSVAIRKSILVLGNCQAHSLAECLKGLNGEVYAKGIELHLSGLEARFKQRDPELHAALSWYDCILVQPPYVPMISDYFPDLFARVQLFPALSFSAYHPDLVYLHVNSTKTFMLGPLGHYNSAIAFWGFSNGLSAAETVELFNGWTYETLGYFDFWQSSRQALLAQGESANLS